MKLSQLQEAAYANQLTGAYTVNLWNPTYDSDKLTPPIFFKDRQVLLYSISRPVYGNERDSTVLGIAAFGPNPYEKVRRVVADYFGEELDEFDFGVVSLIDDKRLSKTGVSFFPPSSIDMKKLYNDIYRYLERAKQI
ncbi:hypothetical protein LCGC14_1396730 [marine sediment metagenome]|uniref:Uncharacterized protein n=1 Tax=marine sediment metagenome TaxID=412755 RepID=A0A0F9JYF5_9ZZZZ